MLSFVEDIVNGFTWSGNRLRVSFGGNKAKVGKVSPKGVMDAFSTSSGGGSAFRSSVRLSRGIGFK
jgi:hypothetical protein